MYAAFSITASESESLSFSLFNSLNACLRFLSADALTLLLLSHVLSLSIVLFMADVSGFPDESRFIGLMIVASPLSCMVSDVGAPVLVGSVPPSFENDLHSGPESDNISEITYPHFPQNLSPVTLSVNMPFFPQRPQTVSALIICKTKDKINITQFVSYKNRLISYFSWKYSKCKHYRAIIPYFVVIFTAKNLGSNSDAKKLTDQ